MPDFSNRSQELEIMDDFSLDHDQIDGALNELEVINTWLGGYQVFFNAFKKLKITSGTHISDWGCGGGDSMRKISNWAKRKKINIKLTGIDATYSAVEFAANKSRAYPDINYILADVLAKKDKIPQCDIVISSLFTHHFDNESWITLIRRMHNSASKAVIVNDLHRHWLAYYAIDLLTSLFSSSKMVKHDGKLSVLRSFSKEELKNLLKQAGIEKYKIRWMWAFRWQLIIFK